jgi:hypothetical protein
MGESRRSGKEAQSQDLLDRLVTAAQSVELMMSSELRIGICCRLQSERDEDS